MMIWLVIGYMFLFVFRPFEYWEALGTLRVERVYMVFLLIAMIFSKQIRYIPHMINKAVISFFLSILIASFFAYNQSDAYPVAFDYFKFIVFYFVIVMTIRDSENLKFFVVSYLIIMLMYVGKSAWEFFLYDRYWWAMGIKRMIGMDYSYSDPNYFAASIVYSLPFLWAMIKYRLERLFIRLLLWFYGGLAIVCIIYSGSRSGMVTSLLLLFLIWLGSEKKKYGVLLVPLLLAGLWLTMPDSYKIRFQSTFVEGIAEEAGQKGADESARGRIEGLKTGFSTMLQHPFLGIGPGNFKYAWAGGTGEIIGGSAHNLYGQMMGELGLCGSISFIFFVTITFFTHLDIRNIVSERVFNYSSIKNNKNKIDSKLLKYISTAAIYTIILLLFNGNFGHNLYRYNFLWIAAMAVVMSHLILIYDASNDQSKQTT